ncbi:hypothetical protein A8C32_03480 [Flavivirga aquatica]|uniref:Peptidase S8 n=1 Tax=Flavivirga aquatica TaxID=1849968 RepID=A0A1E5TB30_9FLAO|nr:S8 family serine peptidase [Flavivirga aquatica]OEK08527.1 hypothetical protein A8C32_03480 [Flavivirga aquatica]
MKKTISLTLTILCLFITSTFFAQTRLEISKIKKEYNIQKLKQLETNLKKKAASEKEKAIEFAKQNNIPTKMTTKDGRILELQRIVNENPIYYTTFNIDAAVSTRTNHLQSGGSLGLNLMGQNMTAYVWDGGVANRAHQEYDGSGGNNRFSIGDGTSSLNFHAEHVTGTIIASGLVANAEGMAPQAQAIGYDWNNDKAEAASATANGMLISNHSYGFAFRNSLGQVQLPQYYFGGYIDESRDWDNIMFNAPNYLMVVAAGNDGDDNTANNNPTGGSGWDKLTGHSTSKNNLVVANANDANIDANGNLISVSINSSSSEGPTDDMRIKPDITGNGTQLYSSFNFASYDTFVGTNFADGNITDDYASITGTSMASPNVTGSLLLLQQHNNNLHRSYMKAATLKGLALHTADDAGASGPDAVYGWGLLNVKAAAEIITEKDTESKIQELTLTSGQTYSITVKSDGVNPLLASISWTDRAGTAVTRVNSTTPVLVNDLDVRVTQGNSTYFPYKLTGPTTSSKQDNNVDPYERVDITGASGTYTITVTHKGSLIGGSQNFSLIISGLSDTPTVCNATIPTGVNSSNVSDTNATISWTAVSGATYDVRYRVAGTSAWITNAITGTSITLNNLNTSTDYEAQVRSKCTSTNSEYSSSINFSTTSGSSTSCISTVDAFPYSESFESGDGWIQATGDDGNWINDASGTPSSNTGPSSGADGSFYMFIEASSNGSTGAIGSNATAILESPCFDLSAESSAMFTFQNHMYGTAVGSLELEISTNAGASWAPLWSLSGNQGNQWNSISIDLNSYLGQTISLRFVGTTGSNWSSDIAIDDLGLTTGSTANECDTLNFNDYSISSFSNQDNDGTFSVANGGTSLTLTNNTWKFINFPYEITANTVIELEFNSTSEGEIHGIGFENDNSLTPSNYFKLYGTQNYGITNYDNYSSGTTTYVIPVGDSYTGTMDKLVFINDNDVSSGNTSVFSNIKVYETSCVNSTSKVVFGERTDIFGSEDEFSLTVYPSPVKEGTLFVKTNQSIQLTYQVINMLGQTVKTGQLKNKLITVSDLESGIYMLKINNNDQTIHKKFIIE